jgi:hypothetical protein
MNVALAVAGLFQRIRTLNSLSSPLWNRVDFGGKTGGDGLSPPVYPQTLNHLPRSFSAGATVVPNRARASVASASIRSADVGSARIVLEESVLVIDPNPEPLPPLAQVQLALQRVRVKQPSEKDGWQKRARRFVVLTDAHQRHWLHDAQPMRQAPAEELRVTRR